MRADLLLLRMIPTMTKLKRTCHFEPLWMERTVIYTSYFTARETAGLSLTWKILRHKIFRRRLLRLGILVRRLLVALFLLLVLALLCSIISNLALSAFYKRAGSIQRYAYYHHCHWRIVSTCSSAQQKYRNHDVACRRIRTCKESHSLFKPFL